jgi:hypothetical protein
MPQCRARIVIEIIGFIGFNADVRKAKCHRDGRWLRVQKIEEAKNLTISC